MQGVQHQQQQQQWRHATEQEEAETKTRKKHEKKCGNEEAATCHMPHATTMWQGQIKLFVAVSFVVAFPVAEVVVVVVALIKQTFCQRHFVNRIARGAARPNRGTGRGTT